MSKTRKTRANSSLTKASAVSAPFGYFVVVFWILLLAIYAGSWFAVINDNLPMAAGVILNTVLCYYIFVIMHEAIHKNISGANNRLSFVNTVIGNCSGVIINIPFAGYSRNHIAHHRHANSKSDPDNEYGNKYKTLISSPASQIFRNISLCFPGGFNLCKKMIKGNKLIFFYLHKKDKTIMRFFRITFSCFLFLSILGFFKFLFFLWFVPSVLVVSLSFFVLTWIPHVSYSAEEGKTQEIVNPYQTAKTSKNLVPFIFTRLHKYHLLHHLYPNVQFNRLNKMAEYESN